ncbi:MULTISPECIES: MerR family DNA-binding transcriptional regulator [Rhodomicrobium]|uniref:MerR family transcriptional regulator n=1 Tax=Rhodomicrobium TaxID=1068 RepID=UPI000B4C1CAB|nr:MULTISPECIES: MerR family DNA-binding transcriptional regulator [Rhodomicrobium]
MVKSKPEAAAAPAVRQDAPLYSIGDLSAEFGISTRAIRFYESKGLLAPSRVGSNRIYTKRDRARLIIVLRGKRLGFSLEEISEYLNLYDADPNQIEQTRRLLKSVESSIAELSGKQRDIDQALQELREIRDQCIALLKV